MISGAARVAPKKAVFRPALPMSFQPGISEMQMSNPRNIEPNVWAFLSGASGIYGRIKAEAFSQRMHAEMVERGIESPIEDMVYIALHVQCEARGMLVNEPPAFVDGSPHWRIGIVVLPQIQIGKYRADFVVYRHGSLANQVIVELDGHAFHDKDKTQRSYEKKRDREFLKAGYKVPHYTGSDVVADPYRVAFEVLGIAGVLDDDEVYEPSNPVGII